MSDYIATRPFPMHDGKASTMLPVGHVFTIPAFGAEPFWLQGALADGLVVPLATRVEPASAAAPDADLGDLVVATLGGSAADASAPVDRATPVDPGSVPVQGAGESCEAFAGRLSAYMREQRGESAAPLHVRTWLDMEAATRLALEASGAFEKRKEAERLVGAERLGAARPQTAPARSVTPGREWVMP